MNDKPDNIAQQPERLSLKRWSRRKLEAARAETAPRDAPSEPVATAAPPPQPAHAAGPVPQNAEAPLPPIESLTIDSEFAAFFKPGVAEATKRAALKQLFRDPRFNIMDGLDVYVGDYTQPDPISPEMMKQLLHTRHIFNPPKTEVNAEGHVVDVVEPTEQAEPEASPGAAAAIAISDGTGDANPGSLPGAVDESAEPDPVRQADPQGGKKA
ncbi:MAG TPA: DUF3306 domain-containing protein [Casimicrobiaceae bacterium]|jgi:hypothetical protein|nr:DUF3306 domain-containing protein [Casimicrobiaceae bacterium]